MSVYLVHKPYLSVVVTSDKYSIFGRVQGAIIAAYGKFAVEFGTLGRRIWKNLPWKTVVPHHWDVTSCDRCMLVLYCNIRDTWSGKLCSFIVSDFKRKFM